MKTEMDAKEVMSYLQNLFEKASLLEEIPKYPEGMLSSLYATAFRFYESGKYEEAMQFFRFLTSFAAYDCKNWTGLGASCQMLKQHEEAVQAYAVAAMLNKNDPTPHLHAAECFFMLNQPQKAMKALDSTEEIIGNREEYSQLLSRVLLLRQVWSG